MQGNRFGGGLTKPGRRIVGAPSVIFPIGDYRGFWSLLDMLGFELISIERGIW